MQHDDHCTAEKVHEKKATGKQVSLVSFEQEKAFWT